MNTRSKACRVVCPMKRDSARKECRVITYNGGCVAYRHELYTIEHAAWLKKQQAKDVTNG